MTEKDKKPDDQDPLEELSGFLKGSFDKAKSNAGEALDVASREIRGTIKAGEKAAHNAYEFVEKTVGKDRIIGGVLGAKAGGTIGMIGGVPGMIKVGFAGAVAGFIGGRKFVEWYRKDDPPNDNGDKPDEPSPPKPPGP